MSDRTARFESPSALYLTPKALIQGGFGDDASRCELGPSPGRLLVPPGPLDVETFHGKHDGETTLGPGERGLTPVSRET